MNCIPLLKRAAEAGRKMTVIDNSRINEVLLKLADAVEENIPFIISENEKDLRKMDQNDPRYDRLLLTKERIEGIASDIRNVASLPSPVGRILDQRVRPNGLKISKVSVPFGVVAVIYEARPNVTLDVFSLCFKSGNACVLKGGSDAINSNKALVSIIAGILEKEGIDKNVVTLLPAGRSETMQLLKARDYIDLIIPRGGKSLIDFVRENALVPVIETGAGICHTYFDEYGDREKGRLIINNAKTRRVSVCNALDCLIVHEKRLSDLPYLVSLCVEKNVIIYADRKAFSALKGKYPAHLLQHATKESWGTEFLSYKMAIKTTASFDEAISHISRYSSKHSEAIISEDPDRIKMFFNLVDAAAVYSNTSTAFTDGAQFGLGAEIGISTQKLHARGPMALEELTTYKWIIEGNGQIRS
ncbi:MAG TPA: glutamate-5-semialdehyde dehydrogenase [Bacteroidales bacterium]|nr:glutamate-5-semialdehyde dehydrogenase [Bacteroidales bacterium]HOK74436.1 glutamate-5-semialdehyde dehydrogenase [Bacteroidales bacterium]HOM40633.1 glutamate-5-semialdehyde dehydrogenase [Bacteroidales bacterium]HPP92680.1 glutamate-5-semialdehyde dehydrogenase [Bacteroidales bacterium]HRR17152.1 glutamate-5-semialdehyde dehydrogenase [Bacteroidales bacterium]